MSDKISRVPLQDIIAEVRRELEMRKRVYIRMIDQGKMTPHDAERRTLNMAAALRIVEEAAVAGVVCIVEEEYDQRKHGDLQ